jgi:hypothetical protein
MSWQLRWRRHEWRLRWRRRVAAPLEEARVEGASTNTRFEPRKLRRLLVRTLVKSARAEDATIRSLDAIAPPDAEAAKASQRALREGFVHYRDATAKLADRARKLPVEISSDSVAAFQAFASDFRQLSVTPPQPDIQAAFDAEVTRFGRSPIRPPDDQRLKRRWPLFF